MGQLTGLTTLKEFKRILGVSEITFLKGKGRQFAATEAGVLFMSAGFKKDEPAYVAVAGADIATKDGVSLEGTLWLVNSMVVEGDTL